MSASRMMVLGRRRWLGTPGYLACSVFSIAAAILARGWCLAVACTLALTLAVTLYPAGLRPLARARLWLLLALLLVPACLFGGPPFWGVGPLALSQLGVVAGLQMGLRAIAIVVAVAGLTASVPVNELAGLLERVGLKGLGFSLGVAMNMLPVLNEMATTAFQALRMRGGFRRRRLHALRLFLVTVVANSLRHADDIVSAAEARAFTSERTRPLPVIWRCADLAVSGVLATIMLALVFVR